MPAVAAVVNRSVPGGKGIQLFYNTDERNLAMVLMSGGASGDDARKTFSAKQGNREGIIMNPSHIGAAEFLGVSLVVAVTQQLKTDAPYYDISIVSPVYRPVATTEVRTTNTKGIAICSSSDTAWVSYLGGTNDDVELRECRLDTYGVTRHLGTTKILVGSSLAAYWCPRKKKHYIIYQSAHDNHLYEYCVEDNEPDYIRNTTDAKVGTPLAAVCVDGKAYLYYTDSSMSLRKIVKEHGKWGKATAIDSDKVDASSQLTVAATNGINHVFYMQDKGTANFTHVRDCIGRRWPAMLLWPLLRFYSIVIVRPIHRCLGWRSLQDK